MTHSISLFVFIFFCLLSGLESFAESHLNLFLNDGQIINFKLTHNLDLYFKDSEIIIEDINFKIIDVHKYTVSDSEAGKVESINNNEEWLNIMEDGTLRYYYPSGKPFIRIYDTGGRQISMNAIHEESDYVVIDLSSVKSGIYIVEIKGRSFKILKR